LWKGRRRRRRRRRRKLEKVLQILHLKTKEVSQSSSCNVAE
jgi:hypothetical protein